MQLVFYKGGVFMRKWMILLACFLMVSLLVSAVGCNIPGLDPTPGDDPGEDPGDDPGDITGPDDDEPVIEDPDDEDPGDPPVTDPDAVTPVPDEFVGLVDKAVIRQGDLWLGSYDGQLWRQTDSGDVTDAVWAPNGHGLVYFRAQDLYYLALGHPSVLLDEDVVTYKTWLNEKGYLWNPDSNALAYGIENGEQMRITWLPDMAQTSLLLDNTFSLGPYWLSPDNLAYTTGTERPGVIIINAMGDLISEMTDSSLPYPVPDGLIIATGTYDPDGAMETFSYTGLARTALDGTGLDQFYDQSIRFCLMDRDPVLPGAIGQPRYLAMSDSQTLFLQKYAGLISKKYPSQVVLLTQDLFLTYSEFSYPFWFSWAPDGSRLAALPFTMTLTGDYGEQEGHWDLVLVDEQGNQQMVLEEIYTVSGDERPVPFQNELPLNWSRECTHVNYLIERTDEDGHDWWQVNIATGVAELILEHSSLPEYRPEP